MKIKTWLYANWGDMANYELIRLMTGQKPELVKACQELKEENYICIGSVLHYADSNTIVWGAGLLSGQEVLPRKPKKICAVRGPKTRGRLLSLGLECPEIYGDPVLLLPRYYYPKIRKKYRSGLVLHWADRYYPGASVPDCIRIYSELPFYDYINKILTCEEIVSSSLHGIIVAEAYGIPAKRFGNQPDFKFDDYYSSKDKIDLDKLEEVCPFKTKSAKHRKRKVTLT